VLTEPADVDDAFQAVFLVVIRKARAACRQPSIGSWLYTVAHRVAVRSRASECRRKIVESRAGERISGNTRLAGELGTGRVGPPRVNQRGRTNEGGSTSRPRVGLRSHPGVRHGAARRRRCEWERPANLSWRLASASDAEWMSGKSRARLARP
jgi:hypothetical protein